jgi:hypothetical protein
VALRAAAVAAAVAAAQVAEPAGRPLELPGSAVKVKVALGGRRIELERAALVAQVALEAQEVLVARVEVAEVPVGLPVERVALVARDGRVGHEEAG